MIKYFVVSGKGSGNTFDKYYQNLAYDHWSRFWKIVFKRQGVPEYYSPNDFFRQDLISNLVFNNTIIAQTMCTIFYLDENITYDLPYFETLKKHIPSFFKENKIKTLMSTEYTSLSSGYSKNVFGVSLSEVLIGLCTKQLKFYNFDASCGLPRRLSNIGDAGEVYGCKKQAESIYKGGMLLDLYTCLNRDIQSHPDPVIASNIDYLFENRIDTSHLYAFQQILNKNNTTKENNEYNKNAI